MKHTSALAFTFFLKKKVIIMWLYNGLGLEVNLGSV